MAYKKIKDKKKKETVVDACVRLFARPNNTIVSLCRNDMSVLTHFSCGSLGFKNCKKSTPHATQMVIKKAFETLKEKYQTQKISIMIKGFGSGREIIKTSLLGLKDITVTEIHDLNNIRYGGCRLPGRRSV